MPRPRKARWALCALPLLGALPRSPVSRARAPLRARPLPREQAGHYAQRSEVQRGYQDALDVPLLDAAEERALGERVQAWVALEAAREARGGCGGRRARGGRPARAHGRRAPRRARSEGRAGAGPGRRPCR